MSEPGLNILSKSKLYNCLLLLKWHILAVLAEAEI